MEALGRLFNVIPVGEDVAVKMKNCSAVTFVCVGANAETFTLVESKAGASGQTLATLDHVYRNANSGGTAAWSRSSVLNAGAQVGVVTTTTANPVAVFSVEDTELSDGFTHLEIQASASGTVVAIPHDLTVQRAPQNLPAAGV